MNFVTFLRFRPSHTSSKFPIFFFVFLFGNYFYFYFYFVCFFTNLFFIYIVLHPQLRFIMKFICFFLIRTEGAYKNGKISPIAFRKAFCFENRKKSNYFEFSDGVFFFRKQLKSDSERTEP